MKIIGISGKAGAGKDTIADIFVKHEGFTKIAFADPLKQLCAKVFNIEENFFHDRKLKDGELPNFISIDHHHIDKIEEIIKQWGFDVDYIAKNTLVDYVGKEIKTARKLMQTIGTLLRETIREDIFIVLLFCKIKEISGNIVINDLRLSNERKALKKAGAATILVKREELDSKDKHKSENDLGTDEDYDVVINNSDIQLGVLRSEVLMWYAIKEKYK